jgi:hypothetical protein
VRGRWAWAGKCEHAQTGACGWALGGWRNGWAYAGYNYEHKEREKKRKTHIIAPAGMHKCRAGVDG